MNERIKKLLDECTLSGFDKPWLLVDHEKFALLIIEECKKAIDPTDDLCGMMEEVHRYASVEMIDKHFGIK